MRTAWLALVVFSAGWLEPLQPQAAAQGGSGSGVAILQVDTDRRLGAIDQKIYGQFLEHINHSVVDGLFAEQIRGAGFEGRDFETYWTPFGSPGAVRVVDARFDNGAKSVRIAAGRQPAGIRQGRVFLESGRSYDGSLWIRIESGAPRVSLRVLAADGNVLADLPLRTRGSAWQEVPFAFVERAKRSRRGRRDRRRRTRRCARRLRVDDARGRAHERHAASRPPCSAPRAGARLHPLARRVVRLHLQMAGRHRPARIARVPPQRAYGAATPTTTASAPTSTWR